MHLHINHVKSYLMHDDIEIQFKVSCELLFAYLEVFNLFGIFNRFM